MLRSGPVPFTAPAKNAIERSLRLALDSGLTEADSWHVLLGLLGDQSRAGVRSLIGLRESVVTQVAQRIPPEPDAGSDDRVTGPEAARRAIEEATDRGYPALDLASFELTEVPAEIGEAKSLEVLSVADNRLGDLPPGIFELESLRILSVRGNQLTHLPDELRRLRNLEILEATDNQLQSVPHTLSELTNLRSLLVDSNRALSIPAEIADLERLEVLDASSNRLRSIPPDLGRLASIRRIRLSSNQIDVLPDEIGNLSTLEALDLAGNRLTELPGSLGRLPMSVALWLADNPLSEPVPQLINRGLPELFSYLRSIEKDGQRQFEGKMVLVGEGNVGKSSLIAALRGEPFQEKRELTHGIEFGRLALANPEGGRDLLLRTWDFGGQEVYRITHQFFFSPRALYLVVWHPREGQEENAVASWCRRIRLRVGHEARILIVATHGDDPASPELDYPTLRAEFGDLLVDHYIVDCRSGTGIDHLKEVIATEAARLPHMGKQVGREWTAARSSLRRRRSEATQVPYSEFVQICRESGMEAEDVGVFAGLLHDLGDVIYYGEDEGLRDLVVLQPEWLTKAVARVLEDLPTKEAGGVLLHSRLREIWGEQEDASYDPQFHPYFLRLMEKFDISFRLSDEGDRSLVAQLVPYERPQLPWDDSPVDPEARVLRLVCRTSEAAPGLVAWLTVRNHRFSVRPVGLHWRRGVFLRAELYGSEALLERIDDRSYALEVRAGSPDHFFSLLRDSIEDVITTRWHGLHYDLLVPCPGDQGSECGGEFTLAALLKCREKGKTHMDCPHCVAARDVCELLTGFATPVDSLAMVNERLSDLSEGMEDVRRRGAETVEEMRKIAAATADVANKVRTVLKIASEEVSDCPRVFIMVPETERRGAPWQNRYALVLWCEQPGVWHPVSEARYSIKRSKDWFRAVAPYANLVVKTLRLVIPIVGAAADAVWDAGRLDQTKRDVKVFDEVLRALPADIGVDDLDDETVHRLTAAQGAGLRALRALLFEVDPPLRFGGLRRVLTASGDFIWVCSQHHQQYDPGLPVMPNERSRVSDSVRSDPAPTT